MTKLVFGPTYEEMLHPETIRADVREAALAAAREGRELDPVNLYNITWRGADSRPHFLVLPKELTGVDAPIALMYSKDFPTGSHKVGATYSIAMESQLSGRIVPGGQVCVWPSTGNFCRGGAFDRALLGCTAVAILPEEMSPERFAWLKEIGAEVIATPGCESNVKEIYDKCWEIKRTRPDCVIFNQFEEFGNPIWHYHLTGGIIEEIYDRIKAPDSRLGAFVTATGSAGTIAAGDYLRKRFPLLRVVATEALQCPTLLQNGFGGHRIEGIGDKHVPWVHNVRNTDMVSAIDDERCMRLLRLFNEPAGHAFLERQGIAPALVEQLPLLGISGICNLVAAIKTARYYEMDGRDVIFLPMTDSAELYQSRLVEQREQHGSYSDGQAGMAFARDLEGIATDNLRELSFFDRKALHNLKYFTWVEQQERDVEELRQLWDPDFWTETFAQVGEWDELINQFNQRTGLL